jgi:hypothetical protein
MKRECTNTSQKAYNTIYMKFYYMLVLCIRVTEGLNPKDCFKRYSTISESGSQKV